MKLSVLLSFALLLQATLQGASAEPLQPMPMQPAELIAGLPTMPAAWKVTASVATDTFGGGRLTTNVQRDLKQDPPPPLPGQSPGPPADPLLMTIHLTDSGVKGEFTAMFSAPKSGAAANTTYLKVKTYPARIIKMDDKTFILNLLVHDRFLVEVRTTNVPLPDLSKAVDSMDLSKLAAMPDAAMGRVSDPVILSRVDELHPEKSRSYPLYWQPAQAAPPR